MYILLLYFADCAVAVEDYHLFKEHLRTCDNARKTKNIKCRHCNNEFQTNLGFFRHIQSHGLQRFYCTLCDFKYSTQKKIIEHMKMMHKVQPVRVIPAHPCKNDIDKDNYLVIPDELSVSFKYIYTTKVGIKKYIFKEVMVNSIFVIYLFLICVVYDVIRKSTVFIK